MSIDVRDAVTRISKGLRSGVAIGNKGIPHRLVKKERIHFEKAVEKGFLVSIEGLRDNCCHLFYLYCQSLELPYVHLDKRGQRNQLEIKMPPSFSIEAKEGLAMEYDLGDKERVLLVERGMLVIVPYTGTVMKGAL